MLWSTPEQDRKRAARPRVLNPLLYAQLRERLGTILIERPGETAQLGTPLVDRKTGEPKTRFVSGGEYYKACCPFCADRRHRLYVCHQWLCPDPLSGRPMHHLATCFNADCLREHYGEFKDMVFEFMNFDERMILSKLRAPRPELPSHEALGPMPWPGAVTPVSGLALTHHARIYLEDRGFDIAELDSVFGIVYCPHGEAMHQAASDRILAPVMMDGVRVGWQGRAIGEHDWKRVGITKYHTPSGFAKSRVLYNYDLAAKGKVVVVVEGVTDVWAVGTEAVALLGKTISMAQRHLLDRWSREGLLILMLDPTAWTSEQPDQVVAAEKRALLLAELKAQFCGRMVEITLPGNRDPAQFERPLLWRLVAAEVAKAGFDLKTFGKEVC